MIVCYTASKTIYPLEASPIVGVVHIMEFGV